MMAFVPTVRSLQVAEYFEAEAQQNVIDALTAEIDGLKNGVVASIANLSSDVVDLATTNADLKNGMIVNIANLSSDVVELAASNADHETRITELEAV